MRVLHLCHNHPSLQPGGTEAVAHALFRTLRDRHGVRGLFLAAVGDAHRERRPGTLVQAVGGAADEMLVWLGHFDRFFLAQPDTYGLATLAPLVTGLAPDIVHVHHPLAFGVEGLDLVRRLAPQARFVFTAHDFFPLCAREGQLLTSDGRLCPGPTLDACHACFPDRPPSDHVLRALQLRDLLGTMDRILLPSAFARSRYLAAGWPAELLEVLPNGVPSVPAAPPRPSPDGRRDRFGFFGHINRFKGSLVLLGASAALSAADVAHRVALHGGTAYQAEAFLAEFAGALAAAPSARHHGLYRPEALPALMARIDWVVMPSVWYENAPLVILEAFRHGRPVICGDVGGMAEMVRDGVDGLHAPVGDPLGLADVMARAVTEPGLWERLAAGIRQPPDTEATAAAHHRLYARLLEGAPSGAVATDTLECIG